MNPASPRAAAALLVAVTFLWGTTFLLMKVTLSDTGPVALVAVRFWLAAAMLAVLLGRKLATITRDEVKGGFLIGFFIVVGYALQCMGLTTISSSMSGLLTALYIPFTAILMMAFRGRRPAACTLAGIAVTFAGLVLLANPFELTWENGTGEWLTIISALACAAMITSTGEFAKKCDPVRLAFAEMLVVAASASAWWALSGEGLPRVTAGYAAGIASLAAIAAFAQFACCRVQSLVPADEAALLYALEPFFAAMIGWMAGDRLGLTGTCGAIMMLAGIGISQGWPYIRNRFFK